jgi:hypothetical protein
MLLNFGDETGNGIYRPEQQRADKQAPLQSWITPLASRSHHWALMSVTELLRRTTKVLVRQCQRRETSR